MFHFYPPHLALFCNSSQTLYLIYRDCFLKYNRNAIFNCLTVNIQSVFAFPPSPLRFLTVEVSCSRFIQIGSRQEPNILFATALKSLLICSPSSPLFTLKFICQSNHIVFSIVSYVWSLLLAFSWCHLQYLSVPHISCKLDVRCRS